MSEQDETETIWIYSTRDRHSFGPACRIVWGELEWYASVKEVRQTALQLILCCAYADVIAELLKLGLPKEHVAMMVGQMMSKSDAVAAVRSAHQSSDMLGSKHTFRMLPVGSSQRQAGMVHIERGNKSLVMPTSDAMTMALHWLTTAEASDSDTLFSQVVERSGLLTQFDTDALFGLLADIRSGQATLPPERVKP